MLGAAVGGALAGPAGAVVGGLSGKTTTHSFSNSTRYLASLELRLKLRNDDMPGLKLLFDGLESAAVEKFADRLLWEIEKRGPSSEARKSVSFDTFNASPRPLVASGWWTRTFG